MADDFSDRFPVTVKELSIDFDHTCRNLVGVEEAVDHAVHWIGQSSPMIRKEPLVIAR
jgi:hypothetical protein